MSARGKRLVWLACLGGAIALSSALVFVGLATGRASVQGKATLTEVTPDEALAEPRPLLFRTVDVRGRVARVYDGRFFTLQSRSVRQGLLVLVGDHTSTIAVPLQAGEEVVVTGEVRMLSREEASALVHSVGRGLPLGDRASLYSDHPYIVAQAVGPPPTE